MKKVVFLLFAISSVVFSQNKIKYLSDIDLQTKVDSLDRLEKNQEILDLLAPVSDNDSIIDYVNIKKSYYNIQLKNYDSVIKVCNKGINSASALNIQPFYINKAVAQYELDKKEEAIKTYTEALQRFPMSSAFYRKRGELYVELKQLEKAYADYKMAIKINPYDVDTHLNLGDLFYFENKFTQALIVYNTYLLLLPDGDDSFRVLNHLNSKYASKANNTPVGVTLTEDDEAFEELDLLISNRVVLSKKYKLKNKIKLAYTKQNHLLFSKLDEVSVSDPFFKKYYFDVFKWIKDQDQFDQFVYTTCYSVKNEKYAKVIKKKEKEIIAFYGVLSDKYSQFTNEKEFLFDGKKQTVYFTYEDASLVGVGLRKEGKYNGLWQFYNTEGQLTAKGEFNEDEKREGDWLWYHEKGGVSEKAFYKNGLLEGDYAVFYDNGNQKVACTYKQDKLTGQYKWYSRSGALQENKFFKEDQLDGEYQTYHKVGALLPKYKLSYKEGLAEGEIAQFFQSGKLYYKANYVNDKLEGTVQYFFENEQLEKEYKAVADVIEGGYKEYYANGVLYKEGNYQQDLYSGIWNLNFVDGKKFREINYTEGKLDGTYKEYAHLDHQLLEYQYKKGKLYRATFYDKDQKVLFDEKKDHNKMKYKGYGVLGKLSTQGLYNVKGGKQGEWKYYDRNGVLTTSENYNDNGDLQGVYTAYHTNGKIQQIENYENGVAEGYTTNYYANGQLSSEYYLLEGKKDKEARYYYKDGTLKAVLYYHKGELNGVQYYYDEAGRLDYTNNYDFDFLTEEVNYGLKNTDTIEYINYDKLESKKKITRKFYNGAKKSEINYVNGVAHGIAVFYHPNGVVRSTGSFNNGNYQGDWKWFYDNKILQKEASYLSGDLHGVFKKYWENGNLAAEKKYVLGDVEGKHLFYAKDGVTITADVDYFMGNKNGTTKLYDDYGTLQLVRYYNMNILIGYSYLDHNGKLLDMIPVENETAKIEAYYPNGKKSRVLEVEKAEFVNEYIEYYANGNVESKTMYENDESTGEEVKYYENGKIKSVANYLLGELNGVKKDYYKNGALKSEYIYKNNEKTGAYTKYNNQGVLLEKGSCVGGFEFEEK